jgi:hypothetical protein
VVERDPGRGLLISMCMEDLDVGTAPVDYEGLVYGICDDE